jgi:CubicO group peptidase (beta-lactamase class C family)
MHCFSSRVFALAVILGMTLAGAVPTQALDASALTQRLDIVVPGQAPQTMALDEAMRTLKIPSVSIALVDQGEIAWTGSFGDRGPDTLYQAASLSKFVTALAVLRLVQDRQVDLDTNVRRYLTSWRLPEHSHPNSGTVTLRRLLSMTAGIGVPGYIGYLPGAPLPSLTEILGGLPPANSPPVTVETSPGTAYAYSGGSYEIVEAVIQDVTGQAFATIMSQLVLEPAGMNDSFFAQPLPEHLVSRAATGHRQDGSELPGGWRIIPELAAGGLWSTAGDLAKLLVAVGQAARGTGTRLFTQQTAGAMLTRQAPGPYGLGAAVSGEGNALVLMKRGQNIGYQSFLILFPLIGKGLVVMTGSDHGTTLANALVHRAAQAYGWPPLAELVD